MQGRWAQRTVWAVLATFGCTSGRFVPNAPIASQPRPTHQVTRLTFGATSLTYRLRVPRIPTRANLTLANLPPCRVDNGPIGEIVARTTDAGGQLDITFPRFTSAETDVLADVIVDLYYSAPEGCVRVAAGAYFLNYEPITPWFARGAIDALIVTGTSGVEAIGTATLGGGSWIGPVKVTGYIAPGSATCSRDTCQPSHDNQRVNDSALLMGGDAIYYPWVTPDRDTSFAFGWGMGYKSGIVSQPAIDEERRVWLHNPFVMFAGALLGGTDPSFADAVKLSPSLEVQVPVGLAIGTTKDGTEVGFAAGFNFAVLRVL